MKTSESGPACSASSGDLRRRDPDAGAGRPQTVMDRDVPRLRASPRAVNVPGPDRSEIRKIGHGHGPGTGRIT